MGRIEKVNQQVKREIGRIIQQELGDPRLQFVIITEVDVSRDLRNARIRFSVLGNESQIQAAQQGLQGARGMIRKLLGKSMTIRHTPELFFIYDQAVEMSARIEESMKTIIQTIKKNKRFLISTHVNPDPDALCSELALAAYLRSKGKKVTIVNHQSAPCRFHFFSGACSIKNCLVKCTTTHAITSNRSINFRRWGREITNGK